MNWIKLEDQLPPFKTLVLVKRYPNKVEEEPIYFAMRTGHPLSTNPDASKDCYWWGNHKNSFLGENHKYDALDGFSNFSDVTVKEWSYIQDLIK
jgi:hypothetical protein